MALSSSFQPLGWFTSPTQVPVDVVATGTLTYYSPDGSPSTTVPVTIKYRGSQHYRIDVSDPNGSRSTIVNGLGGTIKRSDGKSQVLTASAAFSMQPPIFPFLLEELNPANPATTIQDLGLANVPAGIAQRLRISLPNAPDFVNGLRGRAAEKTLWLAANGTPARIDFFRVASDNHYARVQFSLLLSDYRKVGGVLVAFQQLEQLEGQNLKLLSLQTVVIGPAAGITDSDFAVVPSSTVAGGTQ